MTQMPPERQLDLSEVAAEPPEESIQQQRDAVDDVPDTGGLTSPDHAQ